MLLNCEGKQKPKSVFINNFPPSEKFPIGAQFCLPRSSLHDKCFSLLCWRRSNGFGDLFLREGKNFSFFFLAIFNFPFKTTSFFFMIIFFFRPSTHFSLSRNNFFLIDLKTVHWAICERFLTNRLAICRLQLFAAINYKLNFPIRQERMTHVEVEISIFLRLSNGTSNKSVDRHLTLELFNCDLKSISLPNSPLQSIIGQWFACSRLIKLDSSIRSRK